MQTPLQITAHNIVLSDALETEIREKAVKLERYHEKIISCHVIIDAPVRAAHGSNSQAAQYHVSIDLTVPGTELAVTRKENENLQLTIRDAFNAARRQLQDYARRQRGEVKISEAPPHAVVSKLIAKEGYGFLATPDGRELYFHRHSVLASGFDHLEVGTEVRFAEELGEKGPQASTVAVVGKSQK